MSHLVENKTDSNGKQGQTEKYKGYNRICPAELPDKNNRKCERDCDPGNEQIKFFTSGYAFEHETT
jgi:hypothetical protein